MKRILPYILCICFVFTACSLNQGNKIPNQLAISETDASSRIKIIANKPFIKRGDTGLLAVKCEPNSTCRIIAVYRISGEEYRVTRTMVAGTDGNVLCTWKVDANTDAGTYEIEIINGQSRLITTYTVQ